MTSTQWVPNPNQKGFTIVELLIVIVVIAILAVISVVAYNGITQRANNMAIIDAASQSRRLIQLYIAKEDAYPLGKSTQAACITTASGCYSGTTDYAALASFDTKMATVGTLPRKVPKIGDDRYGIVVQYWGTAYRPVYLVYYLQGVGQSCGMSGILNSSVNGYSTTEYTVSNSGGTGKTQCYVEVPGPES